VDPAAEALVARLRRLGFHPDVKVCASALGAALANPEARGALLVSAGAPVDRLDATLAAAGPALRAGRVVGLVVGEPATATAERLRDAGFALRLPAAADDGLLRFQVNRAFVAARAGGAPRCELRAPFGWRVGVRVGPRAKEASLYSLSTGGAFLETARPSPTGAACEVELPLPGGPRALAARVVHTNVPGNLHRPEAPLGMGVHFRAAPEPLRRALERLVAQRGAELVF
jgi:hypothetical protein